jgi:hypothetical protein
MPTMTVLFKSASIQSPTAAIIKSRCGGSALIAQDCVICFKFSRRTPELTGRGKYNPTSMAKDNDEKHSIRAPVE